MIDFERIRRSVSQAFSLLSQEQREAVNLRVIEGRPYPEVATMLSCTEEAARARVSRGLKRLPGLLEREAARAEAGGR